MNDPIIKEFIKTYGLRVTIATLLIVTITSFYLNYKIGRKIEDLRFELSNNSQKHVEIWKTQKDLVMEFIDIFENDFLKTDWSGATKREAVKHYEKRINNWYGKAYVVFDAKIIDNINEIFQSHTSHVQRYYLYRNIRQQLLSGLFDKEYRESPYLSRPVESIQAGEIQGKTTFDELKRIYPFIEPGDDPATLKSLPVFQIEVNSLNKTMGD